MTQSLDLQTFPLTDARLIEASAGTGKTFTLAALYVRLILGEPEQDTQVSRMPPDILVVTFTDAATSELRDRIRERLSQAAAFFQEHEDNADPFLTGLRSRWPESHWPGCAAQLKLAADWMDEAAIYTIHGFCQRILQQHAFDSGMDFEQQLEPDDSALFLDVVRDYWRTFFYPLSAQHSQAVAEALGAPDALAARLRPLLGEAALLSGAAIDLQHCLDDWSLWQQTRACAEAHARQHWHDSQAELNPGLTRASQEGWLNGSRYKKDQFAEWLAELNRWAAGLAPLDSKLATKFSHQKLTQSLVKKHQDKQPQLDFAALHALDVLSAHLAQPVALEQPLLLHALGWVHKQYHQEKQRQGLMTFDDLLSRLAKALDGDRGETLAGQIRRQLPVAMIDEFQDTDPVQYRIFTRIYQDRPELGWLMIGDPKQAIYGFRGADIYTYLKARHATCGQHYTLATNYRSASALVEATNHIFAYAEQQPQGAFRFRSDDDNPLPFNKVNAHGLKETWTVHHAPAPALTLWHWALDLPVASGKYRSHLAEVTASEIVRLLNAAAQGGTGFQHHDRLIPVQPKDIAILVRTGKEALLMREALARRGLSSVYLSEKTSVFASDEAQDLSFVLCAMAEPGDERNVRAALSTRLFAFDEATLKALIQDEVALEVHLERFHRYRQRWQQQGLLPAIRHWLHDYQLNARHLGERRLTNLLHISELLQQASQHLDGEQALLHFFSDARTRALSDNDSILRLESDANLLKIITIHKSKGLEYPLVFIPFACAYQEVSSQHNDFYRFHDDRQQPCIDLDKTETSRQRQDLERLKEDIRLLYVALTRAKHACWLGIAPIKKGGGKQCLLERSAIGALLDWQPNTPAAQLAKALTNLQQGCPALAVTPLPEANSDRYQASGETAPQPDQVRTAHTLILSRGWIASYSSLPVNTQTDAPESPREALHSDEADADSTPISHATSGLHRLPRGPRAGTLIHGLLEYSAKLGFAKALHTLDDWLPEQLDSAWREHQDIVHDALSAWLQLPLLTTKPNGASLNLCQLTATQQQSELEFLFQASAVNTRELDALLHQALFPKQPRPPLYPRHIRGFIKGFIDLVLEHEGRYFLIDYKFNSLGNQDRHYHLNALQQAMLDKRYDLQFALYCLALHRHLRARLGEHYQFECHFGGGWYWFLRGINHPPQHGLLYLRPDTTWLDELDLLFQG
ncbi:MAG: exodeoxyribonuclease V subunit beta [Methylococcales bacterium]|nr:exodeoxyribonuclease V subunit beta [Methylococcales bacterium]